jgi:hypothetical protein
LRETLDCEAQSEPVSTAEMPSSAYIIPRSGAGIDDAGQSREQAQKIAALDGQVEDLVSAHQPVPLSMPLMFCEQSGATDNTTSADAHTNVLSRCPPAFSTRRRIWQAGLCK